MDTFQKGYGGITADMIDRIRRQANRYVKPLNYEGVMSISSAFYAHAPELRRIPAVKRATLQFGGMLSWLDVGLAVLHRAGWRPESSQSQTRNIERALPPDTNKSRFFAEGALISAIDGRNLTDAI